jgi:hypothetical protein
VAPAFDRCLADQQEQPGPSGSPVNLKNNKGFTMNKSSSLARRLLSAPILASIMLAGCQLTPKPLAPVSANDPEMKALDADRDKYREKKVALIQRALNLGPAEHDAFWREYYGYEAESAKIFDERLIIIRDYAANYDKMDNDIANNLALRSLKIRDDRNDLFRKYYNRIAKATSPVIAGQFLQIENELSLLSDLKISTETPMLPREVSPANALKN